MLSVVNDLKKYFVKTSYENMKNSIKKLEEQAESAFSNFDSEDEMYYGQNPYFSDFSNSTSDGTETLGFGEREVTIDIANTGSSEVVVPLFGATNPVYDTLPTDIEVTVNGTQDNYFLLRRQLLSSAMFISSLTAFFSNDAQLRKAWSIREIGLGNNKSDVQTYQTNPKRNPNQNQANQIDDASFNKPISANTVIEIPVLAGQNLSITFQIGAIVKTDNILIPGKHVVAVNKGLTNVQRRAGKK